MDYDALSDDELEAHLNPRVAAPDFQGHVDAYAEQSEAARARLDCTLDVPYGPSPRQRLDIFRPAQVGPAPVHLFIHGGYWRALDKEQHSFVASPLVEAGAVVAVMDYDLCPTVTLDDIVAQTHSAISYVVKHAEEHGGDPARLTLSGHSAGAHLAAMALREDWPTAHGLSEHPVQGVVGISGVYDLRPVRRISVNEDVRLTEEMALRNSPTLDPPARRVAMQLPVGALEPEGWIDQSLDFCASYMESSGAFCFVSPVAEHDHFSLLLDLAEEDSLLTRMILYQMSLD